MPRNGSDSTKLKKNDLILAGMLLAAAFLLWAIVTFSGRKGSQVRITVDGKVFGTYDMQVNRKISVSSSDLDEGEVYGKGNSSWINVVQIRDGEAFMKEADCPDKICVHHRPVSRQGESIVCLPHRVVVEIAGEEPDTGSGLKENDSRTDEEEFDLITR